MEELSNTSQDLMTGLGTKLTDLLGGFVTQLPGLVVALIVVVVSVYFFLVDGRKLVLFLRRNSVFPSQQTDQLMQTVAEMCRSVILAALISGGMQGILELVACILTGTPNAALIGLLVFVASFIPVIGSTPVTLIVALQQLLEGHQIAGVILLIMSVVIIAADNTVRPWFLRGSTNLHPLLAFVAAFGGLQTLGFLGVFLGPILAALFVETFHILAHPTESP
jgi:predicted PurR-regulated permease PerM